MKKLLLLLPLSFCSLYSCDNGVKTGDAKQQTKKSVTTKEIVTNSKAVILNNILVHERGGLKISRAYLSFEDGTLVPKTNRVAVSQSVYLNLVSTKSWLLQKGTVSLDASQKIVTNKGEMVLDDSTLFKAMPPVNKSGFTHLYLQAKIIATRPDIDHFIIHYHVWDKHGDGEVQGSYQLYVDAEGL